MRSLHPSLGATLRAACAVQIVCPDDLSRLSFLRQRARAPSTVVPATLSVAGARWQQICPEQIWTSAGRPKGAPQGRGASKKSGAIIESTGKICGLSGQALPAFGSARFQYLPPGFGAHANAETVTAFSLDIAGLVCTFHWRSVLFPIVGCILRSCFPACQ